MFELVKQYLLSNDILDFSSFLLADDGDGIIYLKEWGYSIPEPDLSQSQADLINLRTAKLAELQTSLNAALVKPHDSDEAEEVTVDELLQETSTGNLFYFLFKTQGTGLPLTEPANLLSRIANNANPDYYLRYSCTIIDPAADGGFRRGYVKITKALALSISDHMTIRGTSNITESNIIYSLIVAAATIEELNAIDITIS